MGLHHIGIRVTDLDASIAFYQAIGGEPLAGPMELPSAAAQGAMGTSSGTRVRIFLLRFPDGSGVELFAFDGEEIPSWFRRPEQASRLPHFGVQVTDVDAALERAERSGGTRLWPQPSTWGAVRVVYLHDPDGNVVELLDGPLDAIAAEMPPATTGPS